MQGLKSPSQSVALSDEQLMLDVARGDDPRRFGLLVQRWQQRIQRFCQRLTGDADRSEDLSQEVFLRLYRHRKDYRQGGHFATYLWRIARNTCYDDHRRRRRRADLTRRTDADLTQMALPARSASPLRMAERQELGDVVRQALDRLPRQYREVLVLRHYEGLKFREIAQALQIPEGTVKSRMSKALTRLGALLEPAVVESEESGVNPLSVKTGRSHDASNT